MARSYKHSGEEFMRALREDDKETLRHYVFERPEPSAEPLPPAEDVFLSHKGDDTKRCLVKPVALVLNRDLGVSTFVDASPVNMGSRMRDPDKSVVLARALWRCPNVVVLFSRAFHYSPWCLKELYTVLYRQHKTGESVLRPFFWGCDPGSVARVDAFAGLNIGKQWGLVRDPVEPLDVWAVRAVIPTIYQIARGAPVPRTEAEIHRCWRDATSTSLASADQRAPAPAPVAAAPAPHAQPVGGTGGTANEEGKDGGREEEEEDPHEQDDQDELAKERLGPFASAAAARAILNGASSFGTDLDAEARLRAALALERAARSDDAEAAAAASLLLERVDESATGVTLLHSAAAYGETDAVKALLRAGAEVDALDEDDQTPLHLACALGRAPVVRLLLAAGADRLAVDDSGRSAASRASTDDVRAALDDE